MSSSTTRQRDRAPSLAADVEQELVPVEQLPARWHAVFHGGPLWAHHRKLLDFVGAAVAAVAAGDGRVAQVERALSRGQGVRPAQEARVVPCIPMGIIPLQKAEAGPTSGPTWRLSHLHDRRRGPELLLARVPQGQEQSGASRVTAVDRPAATVLRRLVAACGRWAASARDVAQETIRGAFSGPSTRSSPTADTRR
jgi:hypothetical protein